MKKPINEIKRMQQLAGILNESQLDEASVNDKGELEDFALASKEDKIAVIKEWIWYTCDEGQAKDDINKYNKMVDIYFADKNDVTEEDFKKISLFLILSAFSIEISSISFSNNVKDIWLLLFIFFKYVINI